jgi:predicted nucleic acid-binding protein
VRLASVVALELHAGAVTERRVSAVDELAAPYAARGRVIVPSFDAFVHAGRVCAALARHERDVQADAPASFRNDALLAASCREEHAVLVTENARDFQAIQRHLRGFRFTSPLERLRRG